MPTPLQRTRPKQRAAERGRAAALGPPVTRLASVQGEQSGHGKPRAGLRRWWLGRRASGHRRKGAVPPGLTLRAVSPAPTFTVRRCAHRYEHRPRPASSRPRPGRRSGVNRLRRLNITAHYPKQGRIHSASSLLTPAAARPAGSGNGRLCLAPQPVGRGANGVRTAHSRMACSRFAPTRMFSQAAKPQRWNTSPRPPRVVCCARLALRCSSPCSPPSRPSAPKGAPRSSTGTPSPCRQRRLCSAVSP